MVDATLIQAPDQQVIEQRRGTVPMPPIVVAHLDFLADARRLTYEEFEVAVPSAEAMQPFEKIKRYWEPFDPGMELKYLPSYPALASSRDGMWFCQNRYEDELVRQRLALFTGGNPDQLRVNDKDVAEAEKLGEWMECMNCPFRTTSVTALKAHTRHWKHTVS